MRAAGLSFPLGPSSWPVSKRPSRWWRERKGAWPAPLRPGMAGGTPRALEVLGGPRSQLSPAFQMTTCPVRAAWRWTTACRRWSSGCSCRKTNWRS